MDTIIERYALDFFDTVMDIGGSYGGNQYWFLKYRDNKYLYKTGCGLIACANMLIYQAKTKEEYEYIFHEPLNLQSYLNFCETLRKFVKPTPLGIFTFAQMTYGIDRFIKTYHKRMVSIKHMWKFTENNCYEYIKSAMIYDTPVMMLTMNSCEKELNYHWVVITAIEKSEHGKIYIECSNWGVKKRYSLSDWIRSNSLYKGIMYYR